ncbi:hypothetical protein ACW0TQ_08090 [Oceanobacillus sp. M60]
MRMNEFPGLENAKLFVKFTSKKYVNDLENGKLFMNNIGYFIDLEKEYKKKGVGDKREAAYVSLPDKIYIQDPETKKILMKSTNAEIILRHERSKEVPIFCFTKFNSEDFVLFEEQEDYLSFKIDIGEDKKKFLEFGDTAIILPDKFTDLLISEAEKKDTVARVAPVEYKTFIDKDKSSSDLFQKAKIQMYYWKHVDFSHQREMRFVLPATFVENNYIFQMDNLKDQIHARPIEDFFENFRISAVKIKAE